MTPGTQVRRTNRRRLVVALALQALLTATTFFIGGAADAVVPGSNGKIVFARMVCQSDTAPCWELVVAHADGTHEKVVAGPYPRSVWDDHFIANWSPDGRRLIFMADLGSRQGIWQVGADGRHLERSSPRHRGPVSTTARHSPRTVSTSSSRAAAPPSPDTPCGRSGPTELASADVHRRLGPTRCRRTLRQPSPGLT